MYSFVYLNRFSWELEGPKDGEKTVKKKAFLHYFQFFGYVLCSPGKPYKNYRPTPSRYGMVLVYTILYWIMVTEVRLQYPSTQWSWMSCKCSIGANTRKYRQAVGDSAFCEWVWQISLFCSRKSICANFRRQNERP